LTSVQTFQELRCPHCGGPITAAGDSQIIKCDFCGTSQQRMDVEKYISQLRADVYGWVRSLVPSATVGVQNVDPVARSQIFEQSLKGEVSSRLTTASMQLMKIGAGPLFLPPYSGPFQSMIVSISIDPKEMLSQGAKFQGLRPFAVSEDHVAFMSDAIATTETLGYLSNVIRIYNGPVQRSYETISRNFGSAASTLEGDKSRTGAALRMRGLASLSKSTELMIQGDLGKAEEKLVESEKYLSTSLTEVIRQPSTVSWYPGIKAETGMAGSMRSILQSVQASRTYAATHLEALSRFEAYVKGFEIARASSGRILSSGERLDPETFKEMSASFKDVSLAKAGSPVVNGLGSGNVWVACWLAEVSYSFETGALFMKRGQGVQERLLVSGTFTMHPHYIQSSPQVLVTDIFSVRSQSSFSDRIMGREKTLTTGTAYSSLTPTKMRLPSSAPVVPAFCTRAEAEKMANVYLERVRQQLQGKMRIGIPSVNQLVYVGGTINNGWLEVAGLPRSMFLFLGDANTIRQYSI